MARYQVLSELTDRNGKHEVGDHIEVEPTTPAEQADLDTLVRYKILMAAPEKATKPSKTVSK
jgi:hypothetical protein